MCPLKAKIGVVVITAMSVAMMIAAIYGLSHSEFEYMMKGTNHCFSGANRIIFSSALLFQGLLFFSMCCFGYLYMFGMVKKLKQNTIPNTLFFPLLLVPFFTIIITSIIAIFHCA
jgi:hypothetical protein